MVAVKMVAVKLETNYGIRECMCDLIISCDQGVRDPWFMDTAYRNFGTTLSVEINGSFVVDIDKQMDLHPGAKAIFELFGHEYTTYVDQVELSPQPNGPIICNFKAHTMSMSSLECDMDNKVKAIVSYLKEGKVIRTKKNENVNTEEEKSEAIPQLRIFGKRVIEI